MSLTITAGRSGGRGCEKQDGENVERDKLRQRESSLVHPGLALREDQKYEADGQQHNGITQA